MIRAFNASRITTLPWLLLAFLLPPSPAASQNKEWRGPPARTSGVSVGYGGQKVLSRSTPGFPCSDKLLQLCEGTRYRQVATELIDAWRNGASIWNGMLPKGSAQIAEADLDCILPGLKSEDPCARWATMELVNAIGSPKSADAVLDFLKKENPRSQAAFLGRFLLSGTLQDHRVVPFLLEALDHSSQWDDLASISRGPPDPRLCAPLLKALGSVPIRSERRGTELFRALAKNAPICPQDSEIERVVHHLSSAHWIEYALVDLAQSLCPKTGCPWMSDALIEIYEHRGCPGNPQYMEKYDQLMGPAGMMPVYHHFLTTGSEGCARTMANLILRQTIRSCEPTDVHCYLQRFETLPLEVRCKVTSTGLGPATLSRLVTSAGGRSLDEYRNLFHGNQRIMSQVAGWAANYLGPSSLTYEPAKLVAALNVALSERPRPSPDFTTQNLQRQLLEARWRLTNSQIPRSVSVKVLRTSASGRFVLRVQGPSDHLEAIRKAPAYLLLRRRGGRIITAAAQVLEDPGTVAGRATNTLTIQSGAQEAGTRSSGKPLRLIFLGDSPSAFRGSLPVTE